MPTSIAALIVTLQPILTNILSGPILNEKVTLKQWIGVLLGLVATLIALISITASTIWQKKLSNNLPLSVSNFYQAVGGCFFHILVVIFFTKPYIAFTKTFFLAMGHQILLVSFGAFTILMFLIKNISLTFKETDFAVTDLSHSRAVIEIEGNYAIEVLKKGSPFNFDVLKKNNSINSLYNNITFTVDLLNDKPFKVRLFALRSFGESLYHSITDSSLEFGYENK